METMKGFCGKKPTLLKGGDLVKKVGEKVTIQGAIHRIRKVGGLQFVIIRDGRLLIQCVLEPDKNDISSERYKEGDIISLSGSVRLDQRAPLGAEVAAEQIAILSSPYEQPPFTLNKKTLDVSLDTKLDFRPISLRHPSQRAIFRIQAALAQLFREALIQAGYTEIFSPKIVFAGAEGGANVFKMDYFGKTVFLAQSPQFYKQMMVGVYGHVFEVAPVYRAEPHETSRHLNEYISMDFEMGPIKSFEDIMQMETFALKHIMSRLPELCSDELKLLGAVVPKIEEIPVIRFAEAQKIAERQHHPSERTDLDATSEQLVCKHIFEQTGSELVFVTHYPTSKRPFYTMEDPEDTSVTFSFDLLFRGLEITTGGQRIHDYYMQREKLVRWGLNPDEFESYLMIHKYGMPPHGGLGLGLERLTMQLLRLSSVKEASLFPRTMNRFTP